MISINEIIKPELIQVFTGLKSENFDVLVNRLLPIWQASEKKRLAVKQRVRGIGAGGQYKLSTLEAKLFVYLFYCRHYCNQRVIAGLCSMNQSNVSRLFAKLERIIAQAADPELHTFLERIKQEREKNGQSFNELKLVYPEIEKVITDVTEIRCNRPKNKEIRKSKTSGKKKQYSIKKQVSVTKSGRIIGISKTYHGKVHDYMIEKQEKMIGKVPKETFQPVDLAYVGINKLHAEHYVVLPPKKRKGIPLTDTENDLKRAHSRQRIYVEHVFARIKRYNIVRHYRGRDSRFDRVFDNVAALHNLGLG